MTPQKHQSPSIRLNLEQKLIQIKLINLLKLMYSQFDLNQTTQSAAMQKSPH